MNLQELRDAVRNQIDLDEQDLPNAILDLWIREGFNETINMHGSWPFLQTAWDVQVDAGADGADRPSNLERISSLVDLETGVRLRQIAYEAAEDRMLGRGDGVPHMFSLWGDRIWFWPGASAERTYRLRGYRKPVDWVAQGAGGVVDADERLHALLAHYACARAYAQLEDEVLEQMYRQQWLASVDNARRAITRPDEGEPLILNGGVQWPRTWSSFWRLRP